MNAVRFEHVSKAYDLHSGSRSLIDSVKMIAGGGSSGSRFYALSDVSFEINKGEAFGIIGRNGAGKSTVLKIIAGITKPTSGVAHVQGLVSSLIELGAGFHPDLTGRENVYMSAAILGLPRKYIEEKFEEIVDFAELWDFIDVPVKKYSSGMYARLGFATAISVDPDILIIDEILSVGDIFFQQKCFTKMREIIKKGVTFIFVTHDTAALQNLCDRTLLLDGGKLEFLGDAKQAVSEYYGKLGSFSRDKKFVEKTSPALQLQKNASEVSGNYEKTKAEILSHDIISSAKSNQGKRGLEIIGASFQNELGEFSYVVRIMETVTIRLIVKAHEFIGHPNVGFSLFDRMNNLVFSASALQRGNTIPSMEPDDESIITFRPQLTVQPGEYSFVLGCAEPNPDDLNEGFTHHRLFGLGPINVKKYDGEISPFYGIAFLKMEISVMCPTESK